MITFAVVAVVQVPVKVIDPDADVHVTSEVMYSGFAKVMLMTICLDVILLSEIVIIVVPVPTLTVWFWKYKGI